MQAGRKKLQGGLGQSEESVEKAAELQVESKAAMIQAQGAAAAGERERIRRAEGRAGKREKEEQHQ